MRLSVRTRLAVTFTAVFVAAGAALVAITISLARQSLDQADASSAAASQRLQSTIRDILASSNPSSTPSPSPDSATDVPTETPTASSIASPTATPSPNAHGKSASEAPDAAAKKQLLAASQQYSASTASAAVHRMIKWALIGGAILVPVATLLGWLLARRALRPVKSVTAAARRVSDQRLSERLNMSGPRDEITELASTFDAMLARLEHSFDAQRQFVANASHELRTPLAVAGTAVDVVIAREDRTPTDLESMAADVRTAVSRAEAVVDSLLTLTRSQHLDHRRDEVDLATLVEDALDDQQAAIRERQLTVQTRLSETRLIGDRALLERLIANLIDNAIRHNVPAGTVKVMTGSEDGTAVLLVTNTGARIPPDDVAALFEPFTRVGGRARSSDAGLGLGLAIVRAIADAHHADVSAHAPEDGGLIITVRLPLG